MEMSITNYTHVINFGGSFCVCFCLSDCLQVADKSVGKPEVDGKSVGGAARTHRRKDNPET